MTKIANAFSFINNKEKFPEGFKTIVGEKGVKLSAGNNYFLKFTIK